MSPIATEDKKNKTLGWCNSGYLLVISYTFVSTYVSSLPPIYMHMHILYTYAQICTHIYIHINMYVHIYEICEIFQYVYIHIYLYRTYVNTCNTEISSIPTYLIMKTKPSFVVFLVFTADYQID